MPPKTSLETGSMHREVFWRDATFETSICGCSCTTSNRLELSSTVPVRRCRYSYAYFYTVLHLSRSCDRSTRLSLLTPRQWYFQWAWSRTNKKNDTPDRLVIAVPPCNVNIERVDDCRGDISVTRHLKKWSARINVLLHVFHSQSSVFKLKPTLCSPLGCVAWWDVITVVCAIGKFTIRDAILFHKVLYI